MNKGCCCAVAAAVIGVGLLVVGIVFIPVSKNLIHKEVEEVAICMAQFTRFVHIIYSHSTIHKVRWFSPLILLLHRVRGCRFLQFCEYFYRIFLTSESYLFICHWQPDAQWLLVLVI